MKAYMRKIVCLNIYHSIDRDVFDCGLLAGNFIIAGTTAHVLMRGGAEKHGDTIGNDSYGTCKPYSS